MLDIGGQPIGSSGEDVEMTQGRQTEGCNDPEIVEANL